MNVSTETLFDNARTHNGFTAEPVPEATLRQLYDMRGPGLDCGPMSGFDAAKVDAAFRSGTAVRTNFICNLGRGDTSKLFGRSPRLAFEEACSVE